MNYSNWSKLVSEKHSSSKVIVSSLLIRADGIDKQRQEFNTKLGHLCAQYPNVHLVNNDNITVENLYDSKHLKRKRIGLLVTNLKDTVFNRLSRIQSRNLPSNLNTRVLDLPPSPTSRILSTPGQREFLPRVPVPGNNHLGLGGRPLYSSVVKRNATNPPPLNIETVLNLLNLMKQCVKIKVFIVNYFIYIYQHIILLLFYYIILLLIFFYLLFSLLSLFYFILF